MSPQTTVSPGGSNGAAAMNVKPPWDGFKPGLWQKEINVRDFIQQNYEPYEGDGSFLAPATERDLYEPCDCGWAPKLGTHYWVTDLSMPGGGPAARRTR